MWLRHIGISGQSVYFLADLMKQHEVCWSLVSCICMPSAVLLLDMFHWMPIYDMVALIARVFRCVECGQRHKISALSQDMQLEGDVDKPLGEPHVHVFLKLFFWSLLQHSSCHPHLLPPLHFHHHLAQPLQPQMQIWLIKDASINNYQEVNWRHRMQNELPLRLRKLQVSVPETYQGQIAKKLQLQGAVAFLKCLKIFPSPPSLAVEPLSLPPPPQQPVKSSQNWQEWMHSSLDYRHNKLTPQMPNTQ